MLAAMTHKAPGRARGHAPGHSVKIPSRRQLLSGAAVVLLAGTFMSGCLDSSNELSQLLSQAERNVAESTHLTTATFFTIDDGDSVDSLCAITDEQNDSGRSRSWFDAKPTKTGCTGTELSYEVIVVPETVFARNIVATEPPVFSQADASAELTATLNQELVAPVIEISQLAKVMKAADSVRNVGTADNGHTSYDIKASFDDLQPVFGVINADSDASMFKGILTLTFDSTDRLVELSYFVDDKEQSITIKNTWAYDKESSPVAGPTPEDVTSPSVTYESLADLRSFVGLPPAEG